MLPVGPLLECLAILTAYLIQGDLKGRACLVSDTFHFSSTVANDLSANFCFPSGHVWRWLKEGDVEGMIDSSCLYVGHDFIMLLLSSTLSFLILTHVVLFQLLSFVSSSGDSFTVFSGL